MMAIFHFSQNLFAQNRLAPISGQINFGIVPDSLAICTQPTVIFDEDFTDSLFNNYNAGRNGQNWFFFGGNNQGVAFRPPNSRNFPYALSRVPAQGNTTWSGAIWRNALDTTNPNAPLADSAQVKYFARKDDDVVVVRYRAFSDLAQKPEIYHTQITLMHYNSFFAGAPHYLHDISLETDQYFTVSFQDQARQLNGNVNTIRNWAPRCIANAHFVGNQNRPTTSDLDKEYNNLVIYRGLYRTGYTNIEQWGELNSGDYNVASEMANRINNNVLDTANPYIKLDHIQLTMFSAPLRHTNPFLIRTGVDTSVAQLGFLKAHVGITKKADFNLDYKIDSSDAAILNANLQNPNMSAPDSATIRTGDANNDNRVNLHDANPLIGFWSNPLRDSLSASATYDPATGEVKVSAHNISYLAISSPDRLLNATAPNLAGITAEAQYDSDTILLLYTTGVFNLNNYSLGQIAARNINTSVKPLRLTVNYKGSCQARGFSTDLNGLSIAGMDANAYTLQHLKLDGQVLRIMAPENGDLKVQIYTLDGKRIFEETLNSQTERFASAFLPGQLKLIRISDMKTGRTLLQTRYLTGQ